MTRSISVIRLPLSQFRSAKCTGAGAAETGSEATARPRVVSDAANSVLNPFMPLHLAMSQQTTNGFAVYARSL
jgi:hypothetical protein